MSDHEGEWVERYSKWFEETYGRAPGFMDNFWGNESKEIATDYYDHETDTLSLILDNVNYPIEVRDEFLKSFDGILDKDITYDCPDEEIHTF